MEYYKIDPLNPDPVIIKKAIKCLEKGGLVVYPTDTLYGLGIDSYNRKAVEKLFLVKQRDMRRPVSMMLHSIQQLKEIFGFSPPEIKKDLQKILPGRVTVIIKNYLKKKIPILERADFPGTYLDKVGIRIPDHPVSLSLIKKFDSPISATSANISGKGNVFSIENIISQFGNAPDLILDAGPINESKGSTIIDFTRQPYVIVRKGDVSLEKLKDVLGQEKIVVRKNKFVITFVCSGNICRSPIAEAILKKMLSKTRYRNIIKVQSAGTLNLPKSQAHDYAINVSNENDVDLTSHLSKYMTQKVMDESDIVFCMAQNHYTYLNENYPMFKKKIVLLKQWKKEIQLSIPSIADPIGHNYDFFKKTYSEIFFELKRILPFILSQVKGFVEFNELK